MVVLKSFDQYPKSIKKAIRYIKQNATKEELNNIKKLMDYALELRYKELNKNF